MEITPGAARGPWRGPPEQLAGWARSQLHIASSIVDNPGGGLLFATQAIGQVKAVYSEREEDGFGEFVDLLEQAEDAAVRREFATCRELIARAEARLV